MRKVIFKDIPSIDKGRKRSSAANTVYLDNIFSSDLKNYFNNKLYYIKTYGCQANIRDEEIMSGMLSLLNAKRTINKYEADLIILNTCAVRENAEDSVFGEIGEFKNYKKENKDKILAICGCMIEQKHIIDRILEKYPFVDIMFGTHNIQDLYSILETFLAEKGEARIINVASKEGNIYENFPSRRNNPFKAYVNISYGCNKFCTYCIVPYTRGKERSRAKEDILKECKELVDNGYQEITLLGQNVDSYGNDLKDGTSFAKLLEDVAKLGIPRLRFLTSYPSDFKDEVIDVMKKYPNIMKYLHLPVQSGSNSILKAMGRRYTKEEYLALVDRIKEKIPSIALSTDIIVGFPQESEEEFLDTVTLCNEVKYASAFTFIYSPRVGTPASKLKDDVTYETKVKRLEYLVKNIEVSINEFNEKMLNNTYLCLVEGFSKKNKNLLTGYTESMKTVHFEGDESLIGKIVKVKIKENHQYFLLGELVNE